MYIYVYNIFNDEQSDDASQISGDSSSNLGSAMEMSDDQGTFS